MNDFAKEWKRVAAEEFKLLRIPSGDLHAKVRSLIGTVRILLIEAEALADSPSKTASFRQDAKMRHVEQIFKELNQ